MRLHEAGEKLLQARRGTERTSANVFVRQVGSEDWFKVAAVPIEHTIMICLSTRRLHSQWCLLVVVVSNTMVTVQEQRCWDSTGGRC